MKAVIRKEQKSKIQRFTITRNIYLISTAYRVQSNRKSIYIHTSICQKTKTKTKPQKTLARCLFTFLDNIKWKPTSKFISDPEFAADY